MYFSTPTGIAGGREQGTGNREERMAGSGSECSNLSRPGWLLLWTLASGQRFDASKIEEQGKNFRFQPGRGLNSQD